jgi:hypothetical protein
MTTYRVASRARFTTIDRETVNDERLSFRARGVLLWLLDKPDDWHCTSEQLARAATEGRDAIRAALGELEALHYLRREKTQDRRGQWSTTVTVYESPAQTDDGIPGVGEPVVGKPVVGAPVVGAPGPSTKTVERRLLPKPSSSEAGASDPSGMALTLFEEISGETWFERFWDKYPRKEGKNGTRGAHAAFMAMLRRGELDQCRDGLARWRAHWNAEGTERRFILMPATFLNQRRYLDTPAPTTARRPSVQATADIAREMLAEEPSGPVPLDASYVRRAS